MKMVKRLVPVLFVFLLLAAGIIINFSYKDEHQVKEAIKNELDLLKDLDSETTQKYISYQELFPDATEGDNLSDQINEVFSLFFRKFDYKINEIKIDKNRKNASASLELTTIDARSLARDFATSLLKQKIKESVSSGSEENIHSSKSLEAHYLILGHLLKTNEYDCSVTRSTIHLIYKDSKWEIKRDYSLENDLVGGLMVYLSDPDILSPEETLSVYFKTLKKMDLEQMSSYLGVDSIMNTSDTAKNSIAQALVEQVHQNFNYKIKSGTTNNYISTVTAEITTFDSDSILKDYQTKLDKYLSSADAVIDGSQKRYTKSLNFLLDSIKNNTAVIKTDVDFVLINDGASWKLQDDTNDLGDAIFGTLTDSPLETE
ncbi:MAG: hypothetical protein PUI16_03040 [Clostridia bacterium]|nr:hypothetical protein [Clostridia bacterium]MDY5555231.1 hypothetical protein [Blautia sp.]